jgi:VWFA-related protein
MSATLHRCLWSTALLLAATAGAAQEPTRRSDHQEQARAALRLIDVVATDRGGRPLTGLKPDDFNVKIGGQERAVLTLDTVNTVPTVDPVVQPDGSVVNTRELAVRPTRWVVIFLDADRIPKNYRKVVLETATAIIEQSKKSEDRIAVALLRNRELRFVQEFAPAKQIELDGLLRPDMLLTANADLSYRIDEMVELVKGCNGLPETNSCVMTRTEEFMALTQRDEQNGVAVLRSLINAMAPIPGRKALIWFSNGMIRQPGSLVLEAMTRYIGEPGQVISRLERSGDRSFERMVAEATRARVSLFSLRAGHGTAQDMRGADRATVERQLAGHGANPFRLAGTMAEESLRDPAEATGGKVVFTPLGPRTAVGLLDQLDGVYTLGVEVDARDGPRSRVKVKLTRQKGRVEVHSRLTRRFGEPRRLNAELTPEPGGGLWLSIDLEELEVADGDNRFGNVSRLALYAHIRNADGSIEAPFYGIFEITHDGVSSRFKHLLRFDPPAGSYLVEAFASDLLGGGRASVSARRGD